MPPAMHGGRKRTVDVRKGRGAIRPGSSTAEISSAGGHIVLLLADQAEALTHPYLARAWAKLGANLGVEAPGQSLASSSWGERTQKRHLCRGQGRND